MDREAAIDAVRLINAIVAIKKSAKILNTFIAAFSLATEKHDGKHYLHGSFHVNGTVSGRMSSSSPNLQNLPSGSTYGKLVKSCFVAPTGWIFVGSDFNALEAKIDALLTHDPNKVAVYAAMMDSHAFNTAQYFPDEMPDITEALSKANEKDKVAIINTIPDLYPDLRQRSKTLTFAMQYGGSYIAIMNSSGCSEQEAKQIIESYDNAYAVAKQYTADRILQATHDGYVTVAFGLRVRTPILSQTILNTKSTPYEAQSEARTAGNALSQSYGLLNNRAGIEMQKRILASKYKNDIRPIAQIHDAQYYLVRDNVSCIKWFNDNLVECMAWQDLPELQHDKVKLGANVELHYEGWHQPIKLENSISTREIMATCTKGVDKIKER